MAQSYLVRRGGGKNAGKTLEKILTDITYTGQMQSMLKVMDNTLYALLILESSGTLTVNGNYTGDVWLCGGGGAAGYDASGGSNARMNPGGGGGYTTNAYNQSIVSGAVVIGAGGAGSDGGTSSYASFSAVGGKTGGATGNGGDGGSGGGSIYQNAGAGQGTTTRPFASQDMDPQCGGGASGMGDGYCSASGGADGGNGELGRTSGNLFSGVGGFRGGYYSTSNNIADRVIMNGLGYGGGGGGATANSRPTNANHGGAGAVMIRIAI